MASKHKLDCQNALLHITGPSASAICWSEDGELLAVGSGDGLHSDIVVYDVNAGSVFCVVENRETRASEAAVVSFTSDVNPYKIVCADTLGRFCQYVSFAFILSLAIFCLVFFFFFLRNCYERCFFYSFRLRLNIKYIACIWLI